MSKPDTIKELVNKLAEGERSWIYDELDGTSFIKDELEAVDKKVEDTLAALSAMLAEIIGEDVPITKLMRETVPVEQINHLDSANLIRRAQRKTAIAKGFTL